MQSWACVFVRNLRNRCGEDRGLRSRVRGTKYEKKTGERVRIEKTHLGTHDRHPRPNRRNLAERRVVEEHVRVGQRRLRLRLRLRGRAERVESQFQLRLVMVVVVGWAHAEVRERYVKVLLVGCRALREVVEVK
jgi:hypothetical protein